MARIAIVTVPYFITTYHRALAQQMVESIQSTHTIDRIAIINQFRSEEDMRWIQGNFEHVELNDTNILARAWNKGIRRALDRGASHVLVANLDIVFHPLCIDNLLECALLEPSCLVWSPYLWHDPQTLHRARLSPTTSPEVNWSCFMTDQRLFERVGEFDEQFIPAYCEDSDMSYRMRLKGFEGIQSHAATVLNSDRGTIKGLCSCDDADLTLCVDLLKNLQSSIARNDRRYEEKWGGPPGQERFTIPFNGSLSTSTDA